MCDGRRVLCYNPYNVAVNITVFIPRMNVVGSRIDIFVNCSWVNTRWQCYSTHNQYIEHHNNRTTQITAQHNNNRKTIAQHNDNYF